MKKIILVIALVLGAFSANAQFSASLNAGLPVGDIKDASSFALSADVTYAFPTKTNVMYGISAGFINYFGKDYEVLGTQFEAESIQFAPISGSVSFLLTEKIYAGTKLGYAVGIDEGNDGGFYYKPMLSYMISENTSLSLSYEGISNDGTNTNNIGLGFIFGL